MFGDLNREDFMGEVWINDDICIHIYIYICINHSTFNKYRDLVGIWDTINHGNSCRFHGINDAY